MVKMKLGGFKGDYWQYGDQMDFYPRKIPKKIKHCFKYFDRSPINGLDDTSPIIVFGSCFSEHLMTGLSKNNFKNVNNCVVPAGLNNIFAIKQILLYIIHKNQSFNQYAYHQKHIDEVWNGNTETIKNKLQQAQVIIISVGLAEYWTDITTGGKFWMGIPEKQYDKSKHVLQTATPEEICQEMKEISKLLTSDLSPVKNLHLVFTLCPVPLNATFTQNRSIVANCISKSICRTGFHLFFNSNKNDKVLYFPVYEWCYFIGNYFQKNVFDSNVSRHLSPDYVNILAKFFRYLFTCQ